MASGIPRLFADNDTLVIVIGYVVMRLAMVIQWLRAAAADPPRRRTALRYAVGIGIVQIGWLLTLVVPDGLFIPLFLLLIVAELAVRCWPSAVR